MTDKTSTERPPRPARTVRLPSSGALRNGPLTLLALLTGVWLFAGMWVLSYPVEHNTDAHLVETGASVIVILTAVARLSRPRGRGSDVLFAASGAGLVLAAFLNGYGDTNATDVMRVNEVACGAVLMLIGLAGGGLLARARGARRHHEDGARR